MVAIRSLTQLSHFERDQIDAIAKSISKSTHALHKDPRLGDLAATYARNIVGSHPYGNNTFQHRDPETVEELRTEARGLILDKVKRLMEGEQS